MPVPSVKVFAPSVPDAGVEGVELAVVGADEQHLAAPALLLREALVAGVAGAVGGAVVGVEVRRVEVEVVGAVDEHRVGVEDVAEDVVDVLVRLPGRLDGGALDHQRLRDDVGDLRLGGGGLRGRSSGSGSFSPLRRSVQSGVGLFFGSPLGGANRRRVEGTVPLVTALGVEDPALIVAACRGGAWSRRRVEARSAGTGAWLRMASPASQRWQLDRPDAPSGRAGPGAVRLAVLEGERLQVAVEMAVPDGGVVERREVRQVDAVRDLGLHRGHGGGGEGARLLLDLAEDGLAGPRPARPWSADRRCGRRPPCSSACCPGWR